MKTLETLRTWLTSGWSVVLPQEQLIVVLKSEFASMKR